MSRSKRLKEKIVEILQENGPLNTGQIFEEYNRLYRHGTTMSALTNTLRGRARVVGFVDTTKLGTRCRYLIWDVKEEINHHQESKV